jgi:hypothetical protein
MSEIPPDMFAEEGEEGEDIEMEEQDKRITQNKLDKSIAYENDYYDDFEGLDVEEIS